LVTQGRTRPWLQDVDANGNRLSDVWDEQWGVIFRDVVILNGGNEKVETYNLTDHDLFDPDYYGELRTMLVDAAMLSQKPWTNHAKIWDVTGDGNVRPVDVLAVINHLNEAGAHKLAPPTTAQITAPYYDVDGDTYVAPKDVLSIINELNRLAEPGAGSAMAIRTIEPATEAQTGLHFLASPHDTASTWDASAFPAVPLVNAGLGGESETSPEFIERTLADPCVTARGCQEPTGSLDDGWDAGLAAHVDFSGWVWIDGGIPPATFENLVGG
jgi:hypothetical protein